MAEQRKLRLVVPKGTWLFDHKDRWNVQDILERAEIGRYSMDGLDTLFKIDKPYSAGIDPIVLWPRDIARRLRTGEIDAGITTHNLILEEMTDTSSVVERCDLHCGYVDSVFATTREKYAEVEDNLPREHTDGLGKLDLFLLYHKGKRVKCLTRYPNSAKRELKKARDYLASKFEGFKVSFNIKSIQGTVEDQLLMGGEDIMFETMATGGSINDRGLEVLKSVCNSTAKLYTRLSLGVDEQVSRVCLGINKFLKELETMVQIRFLFELDPNYELFQKFDPFNTHDNQERQKRQIKGSYSCVLPSKSEVHVDRIVAFDDLTWYGDVPFDNPNLGQFNLYSLFRKKAFPYKVISSQEARDNFRGLPIPSNLITEDLMREVASHLTKHLMKNFKDYSTDLVDLTLKEIAFYRLEYLYHYCPINRSSGDLYPCADVSKLRDEHRDRSCIYRFSP